MVITKLVSGLGNQLFQYVIGRQISINRNVPLKLDTSFFGGQQLRSYKLDHYNIEATLAGQGEIDGLMWMHRQNSIMAKIYRKGEGLLPKSKRSYFKEQEWWVYEPEVFKAGPKVYIEGYWQHYNYFTQIHKSIFEELTVKSNFFNKEIKTLIDEVIINPSSVSIHIRRGDYITDASANNLMGVLSIDYYTRCVKYAIKNIKDPVFYVFSDDPQWVKDNLQIPAPLSYIDIEGGSKDYLELELMSKCHHNIIANSSFSWWGAYLNRNPEKIVLAPKNWVKAADINTKIKLQHPSWITV